MESSTRSKLTLFETRQAIYDDEDTLKKALYYRGNFLVRMMNSKRSNPALRIVDFSLIRTIGTGSFGRVLLAHYKCDRKFYAIKVKNTINERNILAACDHPNILKLYASFKDNTNLYFMTELCMHADLWKLLKKHKTFSETQSRFYVANVFLAFEYLHANRVIFRDLKPENIMIDSKGYLKLIDFGFAKRLKGRTKTICGTPDYMSPELVDGKYYGRSVDWWAFGILIYELNAGVAPFYRSPPCEEHMYERIRRGTFFMPDHFSAPLADICHRLIEKDVKRRLGCSKRESTDVKEHAWFDSIDWSALYKQTVPAPIVPEPPSTLEYLKPPVQIQDKPEAPLKIAKHDYFSKYFEDF